MKISIRHEWHFLKQSDQSRSSQKSGTFLCNGRTKEPPQDEGTALCPASALPAASLALPPSIDTHQALGSPSGRAGAKRLRGLTAPILPTSYPQIHCTDSLDETAFLHELSAHPSPPPFGRYLDRRERQELCGNLKQNDKPKFNVPFTDAHQALGSPSIHRCPPHPWRSLRPSTPTKLLALPLGELARSA